MILADWLDHHGVLTTGQITAALFTHPLLLRVWLGDRTRNLTDRRPGQNRVGRYGSSTDCGVPRSSAVASRPSSAPSVIPLCVTIR
jgi:hypothetical protein